MVAKKKASKRSPVKKAAGRKKTTQKKAPAKKATAKKSPAPKEESEDPQLDIEQEVAKAKAQKKKQTKKEADNESFLGKGLITFNVGDALRKRFQKVHEDMKSDDVLTTMTHVFEMGLDCLDPAFEDKPKASGDLGYGEEDNDDIPQELLDPDYEDALERHLLGV